MANYGDKYEKMISLRLSEKQYEKLQSCAFLFDCSESQYLRMLIDSIRIPTEEDKEEYGALV